MAKASRSHAACTDLGKERLTFSALYLDGNAVDNRAELATSSNEMTVCMLTTGWLADKFKS